MKCEYISSHLSAKLDDELTPELLAIVDLHLSACPSCQAEWQSLLEQESLLQTLPWQDPGQEFWDDYLPRFHQRYQQQNYRWLMAWAAVLLLALSITLYLLPLSAGTGKTAPPQNSASVPPKDPAFSRQVRLHPPELANRLLARAYRGDVSAANVVVAFYQKYPRQLSPLRLLNKAKDRNSVLLTLRICKTVKNPAAFAVAYRLYRQKQEAAIALQVLWSIDRRRSLEILAQALTRPATHQVALRLYQQDPALTAWYLYQRIQTSHDPAPTVWINALALLESDNSYHALVELAEKGRQRRAALRALGHTRRRAAVLLLLDSLRNHELRQDAIFALQKMRPLSTEVLLGLSYSQQLETANLAVEALGLLQDDSVVTRLMQLLNQPALQKSALSSLLALKSPSCTSLFISLAEHNQFRKHAFQALAHLHTPEALQFLIEKLYDPGCRQMALAAIKKFRAPQAIPHILRILLEGGADNRALEVLYAMPRHQIVPLFIEMLSYPSLQSTAYRSLKKVTRKDFGPDPRSWSLWYREVHSS